ncbi:MAG: Uma2 family endonuclease [Candidatus Kapaibacterium sp.]|nr:MAG: Uma2 family endonuclease [Candidatus Kapabacteria bacterium]
MATQISDVYDVQDEARSVYVPDFDLHLPDVTKLITEDDEPVDNIFSAKQQRLLVETLYASPELWNPPERPFLADANVGIFTTQNAPPLVPDAFVSVELEMPADFDYNEVRAYLGWVFGKMPDIAVEIVSNRKGGEISRKMREYARLHIPYYIVFDPFLVLGATKLYMYKLSTLAYLPTEQEFIEEVGLGIKLWEGEYENSTTTWLRWCDRQGKLIPTGKERAEQEKARAEQEKARAEQEKARAEQEKARAEQEKARAEQEKSRADTAESRAEKLAAQLRALGISPEG